MQGESGKTDRRGNDWKWAAKEKGRVKDHAAISRQWLEITQMQLGNTGGEVNFLFIDSWPLNNAGVRVDDTLYVHGSTSMDSTNSTLWGTAAYTDWKKPM